MKKTFFAMIVTVMALTFTIDGYSNHYFQDAAKKEIRADQLPDAVSTAMENSEYAAWTLGKIYEVDSKKTKGAKNYEIEVKDESGTSFILVYDKIGNLVETKEKDA